MNSHLRLDTAYRNYLDAYPFNGLLVALSGGADSVALLHLAHRYRSQYGYRLEAIHVNHGIREIEADRDMAFCQSLCAKLEIPLHTVVLNIPTLAQNDKLGMEEAARKYRYRALEECAVTHQLDAIATAHTATDNLETVLLQLTRGCGSVLGIPPKRDAYIRPLLSVSRADILQYLEEWKLPHIEDSSNECDDYSRNLIRHRVLPILLELNPQAETAFWRATEISRLDNAYLDSMALSAAESGLLTQILSLPLPLRMRALKSRCAQLGLDSLSYTHLQALSAFVEKKVSHSSLSLPGGSVSIEDGRLVLTPRYADSDWEVILHWGENLLPDGSILYLSADGEEDLQKYIFKQQNIYKLLTKTVLNFATIERTVIARPRKAGDRIRSGGMHRSIKKLYCDRHVSMANRRSAPLICNENEILWIPTIKMISDSAAMPCDSPVHAIWFRKGTDYETL